MSARDHSRRQSLAGLTLDDVLAKQKRFHAEQKAQAIAQAQAHALAQAQAQVFQQTTVPRTRSLIDIIRDDDSNKEDRRSWKAFKDKLLLKRAGTAWISTIRVPTSDIPIPNPNSRTFTQLGRLNSVRQLEYYSDTSTHYMANQPHDLDDPTTDFSASPTPSLAARPQFSRRTSTRYGPASEAPFTAGDPTEPAPAGSALRPSLSRRNSTSFHSAAASEPYRRGRVVTFRDSYEDEDEDDDGMRPGRALSAREAVAAQEAAEAAAAAERDGEEEERPVTMSLMDLLEETDREMGFEGSRYIFSDEDDEFDDEEEDEEGVEGGEGAGDMEYTCSVCMVRHKANAISLCGHSYCRMCSRELSVNKGNCPLCNNFILEILEIF